MCLGNRDAAVDGVRLHRSGHVGLKRDPAKNVLLCELRKKRVSWTEEEEVEVTRPEGIC